MSDFFDDSHVTDVGLQGSAGPSVSIWDMVEQGFRQQYRVDSARALDEELRIRWAESLRALSAAGQRFNAPVDPLMYRGFAQFVREGTPVTTPTVEGSGYGARINYDAQQPSPEFEEMRRANEAIRQLNNPDIRTFEQILEEVSEMQRGVESETADMSERAGAFGIVGELLGAIGGSFTPRDPLNIVTAPIGVGRTIAARIASDMAVAAGVVTATEFGDVAPNRALAGLPERDPLFNIAAATLGAGIIRGGIEGVGYGVRRLREGSTIEDIDFDLRDSQLRQMFEADAGPTARAGAQALDDVTFIERNNPYGEGQAAQARFLAELQEVQRVMGGEPMTAVARVLPPMPFEYIQKAADFEIVREQAPALYARMEQAQARLAEIDRTLSGEARNVALTSRADMIERIKASASKEFLDEIEYYTNSISDREYAYDEMSALFDILDRAEQPEGNKRLLREARQKLIDLGYFRSMSDEEIKNTFRSSPGPVWEFQLNKIKYTSDDLMDEWQWPPEALSGEALSSVRKERKAINNEYQKAYRAVEAEAARLHEAQARVEAAQQREAVHIFADATYGRPFNWSALQHDNVQARVDAINAFNDTLDEKAVAAFIRQTEGEGEEVVAREAWLTEDGRVDIGLREPVDPEFRFDTDDGDMSVADAMRDLQDDVDLDEAMRTCLR